MDNFQTCIYKTKDLPESAALVYKNRQLLRIERQGKACWFVFDNKNECEKLSNDFFFGEFTVNARLYYEIIVRLKHRIFSNEI